MHRRTLILGASSITGLWLTGCAPIARPHTEWSGKFAISFPEAGKMRHERGQYEVSIYDTFEVWRLMTPLGSTMATLKLTHEGVTLKLYNGDELKGTNPDTLLSDTLGMALPITALKMWFKTSEPKPVDNWIPEVLAPGNARTPWQRLKATNDLYQIRLVLTQS